LVSRATNRERAVLIFISRSVAIAAIVLAPLTLSAQAQDVPKPFEEGSIVQLQGCVQDGEKQGSFVFSGVTAWPVMPTTDGVYGPRHFWLVDAALHLRDHVGQTIQVTGTVAEIRESEIERNPGFDSKHGRRVAIELPIGDVFTSPELAGVGTSERSSHVDMKITLLKVKVDSLLVVMPRCLAKHP
jgi:hypothetical protein